MVYALVLARVLQWKVRLLVNIGCVIGLLASLSSAPILGLALSVALISYAKFVRFRHRWLVLTILAAVPITLLFLVFPNPFGIIFRYLIFDPQTGYFRLLIWKYAGANVLSSPLFGIGLSMADSWPRPDGFPHSVDSLWLWGAMTFGIPGSILIAVSLISACVPSVRQNEAHSPLIGPREERTAEMLGIIFFVTIILGFTVHIWGVCWLLLGLLAGLRANLGQFSSADQVTR